MLQWLHGRLHLSNLGNEISNIENLALGWAPTRTKCLNNASMASVTASSVLPKLSRTRLRLAIFLGRPATACLPWTVSLFFFGAFVSLMAST